MTSRTWARLTALGLLERLDGLADDELERLRSAEGPAALLRCADAGVLVGGLSVALDVRPDELVGPLTVRMGGAAARLKVADVRDRPEYELRVVTAHGEERWATPSVPQLVHNLNDLFRSEPAVARVAILGEWNDALALWCVSPGLLSRLEREEFFAPQNRAELFGERE